jgi:hypothetical protein
MLGNLNEDGRHENWHKYSDGEDPDEEYASETVDHTAHDIEIISNFSKLRFLTIKDDIICSSLLNGRYPFLFNSFPLLRKLNITFCYHLKFDLEMLSGFPLLKELYVSGRRVTGNMRNLRALKDTLETLTITRCVNVEGNLMDLADFPLLRELNLYDTAVTGDVRDIGENGFVNLEKFRLPFGVVGGNRYEFQRIADAPSVVNAYYRLKKRAKSLDESAFSNNVFQNVHHYYSWRLSEHSPDYYETEELELPHWISFVQVGPRLGWRWESNPVHSCEINWLDPEPDRGDDDYEAYVEELTSIQRGITVYRGYHQPPTQEEYRRLCREYDGM